VPTTNATTTGLCSAARLSSEPKGQELVYAARVSFGCTQMQIEDRLVDLTPGMAVTVDRDGVAAGDQVSVVIAVAVQARELA
jgi:hypothetical protein